MSHTRTVTVANESDIVLLRMLVRDLARTTGLDLADQARISLATSAAAKAIGLGVTHSGHVTLGDCSCEGRPGVRVVCTSKNGKMDDTPVFGNTRWMVNELTFETLPSKEVQVTLVKWRE